MTRLAAMAVKDLRILVRVRAGLFFTFVWPLVVAIVFGFVFAGNQNRTPTLRLVVVDDDNTAGSRAFLSRLAASGEFVIDRTSRRQAEDMVRRGHRSAFVIVKPGFGEASMRMFYGEPRRLEIGSDPARTAETGMIEGVLTKHAMLDVQKFFADPQWWRRTIADARAENSTGFNGTREDAALTRLLGELDTFHAARISPAGQRPAEWRPLEVTNVPATRADRAGPANAFQVTFPQGVVWGIIGCVMTFAVGIVSERVRGTFVRLQMAPLTQAQVLAGKALACFAAITALEVALFTLGAALFEVRPHSVPLLVVACASASAAFVGLMTMVASFGRTEQAVGGAGWALLMPMAMLGGAMIPQFVMPGWMVAAGHVSPVKWAILGIEGAVWRGFTPAEMVLPCAVLLAFGSVCFALGVRGLRDA